MSREELDMWLAKMKLFLVLHGGRNYWLNLAGNDLCRAGCTHYDKKEDNCGRPEDAKILCVDANCMPEDIYYKVRDGEWCAEWVKYV